MKKTLLLVSFTLLCNLSYAQLTGQWVKTSMTYYDGREVEDINPLKYNYLRYTFAKNGTMETSSSFNRKGVQFNYEVTGKQLDLKTSKGVSLNQYLIEKSSKAELVLLQRGLKGFEDEDAFRIYFVSASKYMSGYNPAPEDIVSVRGTDTVFVANPFLYAEFKGNSDYDEPLRIGVPSQRSRDVNFRATFIVNKKGVADSLKIIESISEEFDSQVIRNFNHHRKNWQPALRHGKPVDVKMSVQYRYLTSSRMQPFFERQRNGYAAVSRGDYSDALHHYNMGLEIISDDLEMLYSRALVKHQLGDNDGACKDLKTIKLLGSTRANELLLKWCK